MLGPGMVYDNRIMTCTVNVLRSLQLLVHAKMDLWQRLVHVFHLKELLHKVIASQFPIWLVNIDNQKISQAFPLTGFWLWFSKSRFDVCLGSLDVCGHVFLKFLLAYWRSLELFHKLPSLGWTEDLVRHPWIKRWEIWERSARDGTWTVRGSSRPTSPPCNHRKPQRPHV